MMKSKMMAAGGPAMKSKMMAGGGAVKSKMMAGGGAVKSKMMAGGGAVKSKMAPSGGMPMVMKNGKKVPAFAVDGKGKNDMAKKTKKEKA